MRSLIPDNAGTFFILAVLNIILWTGAIVLLAATVWPPPVRIICPTCHGTGHVYQK